MDRHHQHANAACSKVRSAVEPGFAARNHRMKPFVPTVGIERARFKIGMANRTKISGFFKVSILL